MTAQPRSALLIAGCEDCDRRDNAVLRSRVLDRPWRVQLRRLCPECGKRDGWQRHRFDRGPIGRPPGVGEGDEA